MTTTKITTWAGIAIAVAAYAFSQLSSHGIGGDTVVLLGTVLAAIGPALGGQKPAAS